MEQIVSDGLGRWGGARERGGGGTKVCGVGGREVT